MTVKTKPAVEVFFRTHPAPSVRRLLPLLKKAALSAAGKKTKGGINIILVTDAEIKRLNKTFLAHTGVTDVIAFNHPKPAFIPAGESAPFGDIYICLPVARRQAAKMGHSLETELLILAVHGALHLSGMDDNTPGLRRRMNIKTAALLKRLLPE